MTITHVNTVTDGVSGDSELLIAKPTGTTQGDFLGCFLGHSEAAPSLTGWTNVFSVSGTGFVNLTLLYKIAGPSEPSSYTFDLNELSQDTVAALCCFRGVDETTPINVFSTNDGGIASSSTVLSITPDTDGCAIIAANTTDGPDDPYTPPSGYTEIADFGLASSQSVAAAWFLQSTAAATGNKTYSWTTAGRWVNAHVALNPGDAGVNVSVPTKSFNLDPKVPAAGGGAQVLVPLNTFNLTKFAPGSELNANAPLVQFSINAFLPEITGGVNVQIPVKTFVLQGHIPTVKEIDIKVPLKQFTLGENIPAVGVSALVNVPTASFVFSSLIPTISFKLEVSIPVKHFDLIELTPIIHSLGDLARDVFDLDLTPPFDLEGRTYLVRNFETLFKVLEEGVSGQFTTTDGKTLLVKNGIIIDIY